jgi:hypothetical protein
MRVRRPRTPSGRSKTRFARNTTHRARRGAWTKTKRVTQDAKIERSDSWLTAKTKIALFGDERVKGESPGQCQDAP